MTEAATQQSLPHVRLVEKSRITTHPDGHTTILFPSMRTLGFRPTPDSGGEAALHVATMIEVMHQAEAKAAANEGLTKAEHSQFMDAVARSVANVESFDAAITKAEHELYAPPKADFGDTV